MIQQLSDRELEIYARQIVLQDIGYEGQLKLRNARACIIGLGGLGSLIAPQLVGMGIGFLRMVDRDIVSRSDLHRQRLYHVDSVGRPKVEVALHALARLNPDVKLDPVPESFNSTNAEILIKDVDVIFDGLDSPEPRYLVNRTCHKYGVPYIFGAAIETSGNVSTIIPGKTQCLECFMSGLKDEDLPKCGVVGVHPSILGIVTSIQVSEATRLITDQKPSLLNKLLYIELGDMKFHLMSVKKLEHCPICGKTPANSPIPLEDKFYEETCARDGRRNFLVSPKERVEIDLDKLQRLMIKEGYSIKTSGPLGITFEQSEGVILSILKSGTLIVQTPPNLSGYQKKDILKIYNSVLVGELGVSEGM